MNNEELIEMSALAGKIMVDQTNLNTFSKISLKWTIDQVAEYLKEQSRLDIEKIRSAAKQFNIDKVFAIPVNFCNGEKLVVIRAYGDNAEIFIRHLGLNIIPENEENSFARDIHETENRYSILIYEKNQNN